MLIFTCVYIKGDEIFQFKFVYLKYNDYNVRGIFCLFYNVEPVHEILGLYTI